jgi:aerobic-type carbon monoxide dehydrogenase small subunit (CoxS/CutS family)
MDKKTLKVNGIERTVIAAPQETLANVLRKQRTPRQSSKKPIM